MLSKLGWSQGQTLGKNQTGLLEPVRMGFSWRYNDQQLIGDFFQIPLQSNEGTTGLGCEVKMYVPDKKTQKKNQLLKITQQRYNNTLPVDKNGDNDGSSSD